MSGGNWNQELKESIQQDYGSYCSMCVDMKTEIIPFYDFTFDVLHDKRKEWKAWKKEQEVKYGK